jgi:bacterioferritin
MPSGVSRACLSQGLSPFPFTTGQPAAKAAALSTAMEEHIMSDAPAAEVEISRDRLADLLNEDLAREYQAIIAYVVYSQVLTGAQYMDIAAQLEIHARQELDHALILSRQIDYLGKMPVVAPKPVRTSKNAEEMLRFDLENENETIRNYRDRVRQCEALGEYALAEQIRQILTQEQDHQIDLATALGIDVPDVNSGPQARPTSKRR